MSTLMVQQQTMIKHKIPQNRLPLVHVLTSRTDNDDEKVRLLKKFICFSLLIFIFRKMNRFNSRRQLNFFSILIQYKNSSFKIY